MGSFNVHKSLISRLEIAFFPLPLPPEILSSEHAEE